MLGWPLTDQGRGRETDARFIHLAGFDCLGELLRQALQDAAHGQPAGRRQSSSMANEHSPVKKKTRLCDYKTLN